MGLASTSAIRPSTLTRSRSSSSSIMRARMDSVVMSRVYRRGG
jgi:hypothetical protein